MLNIRLICCVLSAMMQLPVVFSQSSAINDTGTLMRDLLTEYNLYVRPVIDVNETVYVSMKLSILSVKQYDEKEGTLSFIAVLGLSWSDIRMWWEPASYGGIKEILIGYDKVWVPDLYCVNSAVTFLPVGTRTERVRYNHTGYGHFSPGSLFTVSCAGNMKKYPFDSQTCHISFNAWNYDAEEVSLIPEFDIIDLSDFAGNNMWSIGKTRVAQELYPGGLQLDFFLEIKRKSRFVTVNVVVPLFFLSCLNNLVFLLVPESGERISLCITVLLSISVYLTILNQSLPQSSEPVPIISYKVIADLAVSYLIMIMVIINLKLYNKPNDERVPQYVNSMYNIFTCARKKTTGVKPSNFPEENEGSIVSVEDLGKPEKNQIAPPTGATEYAEQSKKLTWREISLTIDFVSFIVFNFITVCSLYIFIKMTCF